MRARKPSQGHSQGSIPKSAVCLVSTRDRRPGSLCKMTRPITYQEDRSLLGPLSAGGFTGLNSATPAHHLKQQERGMCVRWVAEMS